MAKHAALSTAMLTGDSAAARTRSNALEAAVVSSGACLRINIIVTPRHHAGITHSDGPGGCRKHPNPPVGELRAQQCHSEPLS
jgi:hypothetical protein